MTEQESPIGNIIAGIEKGRRPIDKRVAYLLEELYFSDAYAIASPNVRNLEPIRLDAVRLVDLKDDRLDGLVVSFNKNREETAQMREVLIQRTSQLESVESHFRPLRQNALNMLRRQGLRLAASMQIGKTQSGEEAVQVAYPKIYRQLLPVGLEYGNDLAYGVAISFLKDVPFGENGFQIDLGE